MNTPENDSNDIPSNDQRGTGDDAEGKQRFQLKRFPFLLFGRVRWEPPHYLRALGRFLLAPVFWLNARRLRSPRAFAASFSCFLVLVVGPKQLVDALS